MAIPRYCHYDKTSGCFHGFFEVLSCFYFCYFSKKQIEIFGSAYHMNDLSQLYGTWVCCFIMAIPWDIFQGFFESLIFFCYLKKNR